LSAQCALVQMSEFCCALPAHESAPSGAHGSPSLPIAPVTLDPASPVAPPLPTPASGFVLPPVLLPPAPLEPPRPLPPLPAVPVPAFPPLSPPAPVEASGLELLFPARDAPASDVAPPDKLSRPFEVHPKERAPRAQSARARTPPGREGPILTEYVEFCSPGRDSPVFRHGAPRNPHARHVTKERWTSTSKP